MVTPALWLTALLGPPLAAALGSLVDDYLEHNPTRNRALDFLPLFTELDEPRVRAVVEDELVKARPALHYRLPNSEIDDPEWGIHLPWSRWLQVEHLAADEARLAEGRRAYAHHLHRSSLRKLVHDWSEEVEPWLLPADALGSA